MHRHATGVLWILAYLVVVSSPLLLMAVRPVPPARPLLVEASIALGFVGFLMMAIQFVLIGRIPSLSLPFGIDHLLRYHRHVAGIALALVILHSALLVLHDPALLAWYDPVGGTWASRTGAWAVYAFVLLTLLSLFRRQLRIGYEAWRWSHTALGLAALGCAAAHVHLAGRYTTELWKEAILIALAVAMVGAFAYVRLVKPALLRRQPYEVTAVRPERGKVWSLALQARGHMGVPFLPGQYGYLKLGSPYSLDEHPLLVLVEQRAAGPDRVRDQGAGGLHRPHRPGGARHHRIRRRPARLVLDRPHTGSGLHVHRRWHRHRSVREPAAYPRRPPRSSTGPPDLRREALGRRSVP